MHDLSGRLDDPVIRDLVAPSVYPDPVRLARAIERYRPGHGRTLLGWESDGMLAGCIGFERTGPGEATVWNIAVRPDYRRRGAGRAMLDYLRNEMGYARLELETDGNAVEFYRACGFDVTSLGELWPGTERFRCVWTRG